VVRQLERNSSLARIFPIGFSMGLGIVLLLTAVVLQLLRPKSQARAAHGRK
jgi:hypothetical protein